MAGHNASSGDGVSSAPGHGLSGRATAMYGGGLWFALSSGFVLQDVFYYRVRVIAFVRRSKFRYRCDVEQGVF